MEGDCKSKEMKRGRRETERDKFMNDMLGEKDR
jgi:hypothetical protein